MEASMGPGWISAAQRNVAGPGAALAACLSGSPAGFVVVGRGGRAGSGRSLRAPEPRGAHSAGPAPVLVLSERSGALRAGHCLGARKNLSKRPKRFTFY